MTALAFQEEFKAKATWCSSVGNRLGYQYVPGWFKCLIASSPLHEFLESIRELGKRKTKATFFRYEPISVNSLSSLFSKGVLLSDKQ